MRPPERPPRSPPPREEGDEGEDEAGMNRRRRPICHVKEKLEQRIRYAQRQIEFPALENNNGTVPFCW